MYQRPPPGNYRCQDRSGVVHIALDRSWIDKLDWNERGSGDDVDETLCGENNYMKRVETDVTCIVCLAEDVGEEG